MWNSAVTISRLLKVNNSLYQNKAKFLCFSHCVVNVRITMVTLYTPRDVLW